MEGQCYDLHPCEHCDKNNHLINKYSQKKNHCRLYIQYERIDPWQ